MEDSPKRTALVTGASAGIGEAFARELASRGLDLVLTARRQDRLQALATELSSSFPIRALVIPADLSDPGAPVEIFQATEAAGVAVDVLVNNAGYGVAGHFSHNEWKKHGDFIQVMVTAVAHLTHLYLEGMVQREYGRVINVSSLAGLIPGSAGHTLYGASKAFLNKMSESLTLELAGANVHVTASCPGFTYSEFHDVLGNRDQVSKIPGYMWMDADTVVRDSLAAVERGDAVYVPGWVNRTIGGLLKLVPHKAALGIMGRRSEKLRKQD